MGRIVDLCGEVAAAADEGGEGLVLSPEAWDRLREDWKDDEIEDALPSCATRCSRASSWTPRTA